MALKLNFIIVKLNFVTIMALKLNFIIAKLNFVTIIAVHMEIPPRVTSMLITPVVFQNLVFDINILVTAFLDAYRDLTI